MVIDVLCAYLRLPYTLPPGPLPEEADQDTREEHRAEELDYAAMREVRHTILRIFRSRLCDHTRWRDKDYDFTGVVFDGGDLSNACFAGGKVSFAGARFISGKFTLAGAEFRSQTRLDFTNAEFSSGEVSFASAWFDGYTFFPGAVFNGAEVSFDHATFSRGPVDFTQSLFLQSQVSFLHTNFGDHRVDFTDATFYGVCVDFTNAHGLTPQGLMEASAGRTPNVVRLSEDWHSTRTT